MRTRYFALAVASIASSVACRETPAAVDAPSADAEPDGPDGVGCTPTTPRMAPPETFVGPTGLQTRIGSLIDSAQHTLDIHMYLFTVHALADKIVAAHQRGVSVRIILDPDEAGNAAVRPAFQAAGIATVNASTVYTFSHAKYLLIDRASAVIMSMNFNIDAMSSERNYGMVDTDPEDVSDVQAIFDQDFALGSGMSPKPADLTCTRLIVSPVNSHARILDLINGSKTTLDVEVLYITDATVRNAIGAAKARGVTVRVILENPSDQAPNADLTTYFKNGGVPVRYAEAFYCHAKLIISDGIAFVGSENMSPTSLAQNREVGALVFEPTQAAVIQQQFDVDWSTTTPA